MYMPRKNTWKQFMGGVKRKDRRMGRPVSHTYPSHRPLLTVLRRGSQLLTSICLDNANGLNRSDSILREWDEGRGELIPTWEGRMWRTDTTEIRVGVLKTYKRLSCILWCILLIWACGDGGWRTRTSRSSLATSLPEASEINGKCTEAIEY